MTNRSPSRARARTPLKLASVVLALIASAACVPQTGGVNAAGRPQDGIPGPPEATPGQMDDYIQQIDFGAGAAPSGIFEGPLKCGTPTGCGGRAEVRLRIVPSNYAPGNDWERALNNGNGYVVAKVANLDGVPFDRFNMGAYDVAYLWVGNVGNSVRTAALYKRNGTNVQRIFTFNARRYCRSSAAQLPAVHVYVPSYCTQANATPFRSPVQLASIEPFGALGIYLVNALTSKFAPVPAADGLWISCSLGCCEVQFDGVQ